MTLRGRLAWMIVALLVPSALFFAWVVVTTAQRELDAAKAQLRETTRALSLVVDRELDKRGAVARSMAASPALQREDLRAFYEQAVTVTHGADHWIVLVDQDDQLLNTSVPFGTPLPKRSWTPDRPLSTDDQMQVSNLRIGPVSKKPVLAVFAGDRHFRPPRFNVGVAFTPAALQNILVEQRLPAGWIASVIDREHQVVARLPDPQQWLGKKTSPDVSAALARHDEGFVDAHTLDGQSVLAFYSRSPGHGFAFLIGVPHTQLSAAAQRAAWQSAGMAAMLALLGGALAAWAARRVREPILRLEQAARQLERDQVPEWPETGLAEVDAVGSALRRAGMQAALDLTERQQALDELRGAEEAQRLLVRLHDATRGLHDPARVQWEIVQIVGQHFGVSRCAYAEVDASLQAFAVARDYVDGVGSVAGRRTLQDFGAPVIDTLHQGRTLAIVDIATDPRTSAPAVRATYAALQVRATLCVPLVKEGRLAAALLLHHRLPRHWSADDATLLEQVAERCWYAVETARAEAALRESRDVLSLAMRSGRMGAWSRDLASERVWWSRELEEIFGLPPGAFGMRTDAFMELVHPEDAPRVSRAVEEALATREDYTVEFRFRHASGEWRWMEGRGRAVYAADGRPQMLYGLGIDISARKQSEDELRRLNAELSDADRRKDEFLATLAHELRNPLAPITNALEILRVKDPGDEETRWTRDVIDRQVRQMTRLVDDLLDVARITRGKIALRRERMPMSTLVNGAVEAARPTIQAAGHALDVQLPDTPVWLDADPTRLTQVLGNLLTNAAKYTPRGGHLQVVGSTQGADALVTVRDDGIGIAPEHLDSVFEMFSQVVPALERSQGGLGIGLALARGLAELHGGGLSARSAGPGRGSEFELRLPQAEAPVAAAGPAKPAPGAPALRVLVVDDNRDAADSLAVMLELHGHEVAVANDGPTALALAASFRPQAVLLDIGMPGMNGYEVAERLRAAEAAEPAPSSRVLLVALTGWGQDEDKRRAMAAGFDHHLTKPVDLPGLAQVLDAARPACDAG